MDNKVKYHDRIGSQPAASCLWVTTMHMSDCSTRHPVTSGNQAAEGATS